MAIKTKDMTTGKPVKLILSFALPLMAGNICQQLYTLTDTAVVGQFVGVKALAALGAADWLGWMIIGVVSGFAQGFGILMAQRFGAEDMDGLRRTIAMSTVLSAIIGALVTAGSLLFLPQILGLLNTPADILDDALLYMRIYYSGMPVVTAYNLLSNMLRALGDSRTPLKAMLIASAVNIALDLLFVIAFKWGIAGAAVATLIAQVFAMTFCLRAVLRAREFKLGREHFAFSGDICAALMRMGVPVAFQNIIISIGGLALQYVINGFGFIFIAGFTATNKLYGLLELAAISFGAAMSTYAGQNLGAGRYDRIRAGVRAGMLVSMITSASIAVIALFAGKYLLALFISGEPGQAAQVMDIAYRYLFIMSAFLPILYALHAYRSVLQGIGNTVIPMVSGLFELIMRVGVAFTLTGVMGETGIFVAEPAAWLGAVVLLMPSYYYSARRFPDKRQANNKVVAEE